MIYSDDKLFCPKCGKSLKREKMQIFANMGKNGLTSFTYKLPDGTTINSKGNVTIPLAKGMSYTANTKKKKQLIFFQKRKRDLCFKHKSRVFCMNLYHFWLNQQLIKYYSYF